MRLHDVSYICIRTKDIFTPVQTACLATACFCSLVTFSAMANADGYSTVSAFQFTVAAGVLIWLYSGALLVLLLTSGSGQPPTASFETYVKNGNRLALFFSYSGERTKASGLVPAGRPLITVHASLACRVAAVSLLYLLSSLFATTLASCVFLRPPLSLCLEGAIACSAISSDLNEYDCTNAFCSKVTALLKAKQKGPFKQSALF
jgi:hypothetical protein